MPGYNHYPDCTCGWCVKYGGTRIDRASLRRSLQERDAQIRLDSAGVGTHLTACFVNPNARCPVCGARVFYYQNARGSRVFFDDLGPPWPKHPCTDNRSQLTPAWGEHPDRPTARKRGESLELVEAAEILGRYIKRYFTPEGHSDHWTPIEIHEVKRDGWKNDAVARYLESPDREMFRFCFDSSEEHLSAGDIIMRRGNEISLFDISAMKHRRYNILLVE